MGRGQRRVVLALIALAIAVLGALSASGDADRAGDVPGQAVVDKVVDGDTIVVRIGGAEERVRLLGIDTPESVDPRRPVECFGKEASRRTAELLPPGTSVTLERDVEARDRYGRLLAHVYRTGDGTYVNLALVAEGFAQILTIPPNVAHVDELRSAATAAREGARGLWAACPAETDR